MKISEDKDLKLFHQTLELFRDKKWKKNLKGNEAQKATLKCTFKFSYFFYYFLNKKVFGRRMEKNFSSSRLYYKRFYVFLDKWVINKAINKLSPH